jgi:hypothetical protein
VQGIAVAASINHLRSASLDTGARPTLGSPTVYAASIPTRLGPMLALAAAAFVLLASTPAFATPETLKRSVGNILFAPFDIAAAPITAGKALYTNMQEIDDARWKRIVFPIPGYVWILGVQIGGGAIREIAGLLELVPGLGLLFFDADLDPLYSPVERNDALVDLETPPLNIKFGVNYISSPGQ